MKTIKLLLLSVFFLSIKSYSQNKDLIAAWFWEDSTKTHSISMFIKNEKEISQMLDFIKSSVMTKDNTKAGIYTIKNGNTLEISWSDGIKEERKFKFLDKYKDELQVTIKNNDSKNITTYIFNKVVDEEVK